MGLWSGRFFPWHCPGPPGRLSALSVFLCKSVFYGDFVWARRALTHQKTAVSGPAGQLSRPGSRDGLIAPIVSAGLDEGLLSFSRSDLLYMENPYSYKKFQ